ncbi:hypothetical protein COOONC_01970 [Cooperia oncophora]
MKQSIASAFTEITDLAKPLDAKQKAVAEYIMRLYLPSVNEFPAKPLDAKQKAVAEYIMRLYLPSVNEFPGINDINGRPGSNNDFNGNNGGFGNSKTGYPWNNNNDNG